LLKAQKSECEIKLENALKLTSGLGSEKIRWGESAVNLRKDMVNLLGDILVAVGCISYLGAFTGNFRSDLIENCWLPKIASENIVCTEDFSFQRVIGNPLET